MEKQWEQWQTIFLGSIITSDGDCSHESKRWFLFGRKAMKNLDSILKSRDITLLTKVRIVKSMVFPVLMYRCESWAIKKAEHWKIDAFELWCWGRLLRVPWTAIRLQIIQSETAGLWPPHAKSWLIGKDFDAGRDWGQEEKGTTEDEMAGWHHRLDGREFMWTPGVGDGQGGLACCGSMGSQTWTDWATELNWTERKSILNIH